MIIVLAVSKFNCYTHPIQGGIEHYATEKVSQEDSCSTAQNDELNYSTAIYEDHIDV